MAKKINSGQKLYSKAKKLIPGGTMLFSKKPELYLPDRWPSYYSKAKGSYVWDLDNNKYLDMIFSVGTNTLGYCNKEVDNAVIKAIKKSNMSTFCAKEEVLLADKLISMHNWAEKIRFARTGGEANAISVRIARAYTNRENIAICGYHGWHDWYIAANLKNNKSLNTHLMDGLNSLGVPKKLVNSVFPFKYNNFDELVHIVNKHKIGIIKMEVSRNQGPKDDFLIKVRKLCDERSIILIFDECTSGFRQSFGGMHKIFGVNPDIMLLGKALGNGYPITAILGRGNIMKQANETFISSTFWTERLGYVAALKTLEVMKRDKSWRIITNKGKKIIKGWKKLAKKYKLEIKINGFPSIPSFVFENKNHLKFKTFITQEMLKKNILASNFIYLSCSHTDKQIEKYFIELEKVFKKIEKFYKNNNVDSFLESTVSQGTFKRLN
ncbi:MAG: hypothetical protein CBB97_00875 [Candidatus Endolissoclinum sp. TMED37]|nr:MAG: hypothetical protein CBB97_00875 [Candidatus Endolissoclinum sp. TMED37]|tara:strand:+ start:148 stop:1461 length:1314 start_codon:yes stop_codon:yes gene_type:complete